MARYHRRVGYGWPLILAIGLHLGLLVISVIRFPTAEREPPNQAIVQATLVRAETATDQAQQAQQQAQAAAEAERQAEQAAQAEVERRAEAERQRQADEAARAAEREQVREAAEQAAAEAERRAEEAARQEAERQRQAEEARRQREAEEQRQREAEAERQRQAEEEARRQQEAEEQRQREAEAERQRQAEEEARRQREAEEQRRREEEEARRAAEAAQNSLDQAIAGESEAVANARQAQEAANGFINLVRQAVEQAWVIPPNVPNGATAEIAVRLGPSGELFAAHVGRSSGSSAFDSSALQAVETAAPFAELRELPASVQRQYREFNLRFRPGDIR